MYKFEESFIRLNDSEIPYYRFNENACDFISPFFHCFFISFRIIEWDSNHFFSN